MESLNSLDLAQSTPWRPSLVALSGGSSSHPPVTIIKQFNPHEQLNELIVQEITHNLGNSTNDNFNTFWGVEEFISWVYHEIFDMCFHQWKECVRNVLNKVQME